MVTYGARHGRRKQLCPREGTKARKVYDHFISNEGEPVDTRALSRDLGITGTEINGIIERLNNTYGVFILNQGRGYYILLTEAELV